VCQLTALARPGRLAATAVGLEAHGLASGRCTCDVPETGGTRCPGVPEQGGFRYAQVARDSDPRERLSDSNSWWRTAAAGGDRLAWRATDPVLAARAPFDIGYRSDLLDDVADNPVDDKLVVLRGRRRVGKSVLLKDTAAALCSRDDFDLRQLIYLPADGMGRTSISPSGLRSGEERSHHRSGRPVPLL
jgi:hypothetical protein